MDTWKLGRHGGREGKSGCTYCMLSIVRVLCVSLVHVVEPFCGRILKLHACGTSLQKSDTNANSAM